MPYLTADGRVAVLPAAVRPFAAHFTAIAMAASASLSGIPKPPSIRCRRRPKRSPCPGLIVAKVGPEGNIEWGCPSCGDQGVLTHWQGTPWDLRPRSHVSPAARPSPPGSPIPGTWRIESSELWSREILDLRSDAEIRFEEDGSGGFRFAAVVGHIDSRYVDWDGRPGVEFSWAGRDGKDAALGRGWAVLEGEVLRGRLFFHGGDDSGFVAFRRERGASGKQAGGNLLHLRKP